MARRLVVAAVFLAAWLPASARGQDPAAGVDQIFAGFAGDATPGCTVGVSRAGGPVLERAYGMADRYRFVRDGSGRVTELSAIAARGWDLHFRRVPAGTN
jgi:CubicO group peptidase (beta-lactamase class C family)